MGISTCGPRHRNCPRRLSTTRPHITKYKKTTKRPRSEKTTKRPESEKTTKRFRCTWASQPVPLFKQIQAKMPVQAAQGRPDVLGCAIGAVHSNRWCDNDPPACSGSSTVINGTLEDKLVTTSHPLEDALHIREAPRDKSTLSARQPPSTCASSLKERQGRTHHCAW